MWAWVVTELVGWHFQHLCQNLNTHMPGKGQDQLFLTHTTGASSLAWIVRDGASSSIVMAGEGRAVIPRLLMVLGPAVHAHETGASSPGYGGGYCNIFHPQKTTLRRTINYGKFDL